MKVTRCMFLRIVLDAGFHLEVVSDCLPLVDLSLPHWSPTLFVLICVLSKGAPFFLHAISLKTINIISH